MAFYSLNPLAEIFETKQSTNARTLRTNLAQKFSDTFYVFAGSFFDTKRNHAGVFDYLTLFIPYALAFFGMQMTSKSRQNYFANLAANGLGILAGALAIITNPLRYPFAFVATAVLSPFVLVSHGFSLINGHSLKEKANHLELNILSHRRNDQNVRENILIPTHLNEFLAQKNITMENLSVHAVGTTKQLTLEFRQRATGASSSFSCDGCLGTDHIEAKADFDLSKEKDRAVMNALTKLNIGGIANKLYKRNFNFNLLKPAANVPQENIDTHTEVAKHRR